VCTVGLLVASDFSGFDKVVGDVAPTTVQQITQTV
jgi:hypothetical protein